MKQLYYTLITLIRGHGSNTIKVISLTLGLLIGIILFARVAFELSYNTGYEEPDKLSVIMATYNVDGMPSDPISVVMGPVPRTIMAEFPEEVQAATLVKDIGRAALFVGEQRFTGGVVMSDTLFFETMGITVTSGSPMDLARRDVVFVSNDFARQTFATTDVIGKTYMIDKKDEYIIRGTFTSVAGENNSIRPDVVVSIEGFPYYMGWGGGASFEGFIRLHNSADMDKVNRRIDAVMEKYIPPIPGESTSEVKYHLQNLREQHITNPNVKKLITVMSFLAFTILFIAAMNYVLIAISGLSRRAKSVGVHKCNGATTGQVFNMFLLETGTIILISVLLVILLIVNLKGLVENSIEAKIGSLFTLQMLWVPLLIICFVFIIAGVVPGRLFSRIPITQVFHKYSERNSSWKRILLFIQFGGVALVFGLFMVIYAQYNQIINYDQGFQPKNIATAYVRMDDMELAQLSIENLPMVESAALSDLTIGSGWSGEISSDDTGREFSSRINGISPRYISLYDFTILEGRNVSLPGEVLVNQEYIKRMRWTDGALGKQSSTINNLGTIVGVVKDFVDNSLYLPPRPVILYYNPENFNCISVKLREPFKQSLQRLNEEMKTLFPSDNVEFDSLEEDIEYKYSSIKRFRDSSLVAFISIFFISLMGLFGYINDEIQRRSKEIAVRKINGAESWDIYKLLSCEVSFVALPAIITGIVISYFIGIEWLNLFAGTQIDLNIAIYLLLSFIIYAVIIISVILKSWRIANENPVVSIKSE
jgi:Predicted ABC-type transport system involved in lysophospholipase L1 biosynthesis, permease component